MPVRTPLASRIRGPHREHVAARAEPTPKTHPQLFTAKGERKWKVPPAGAKVNVPPAEREKVVTEMFDRVSQRLGHTPGVCRESYVDPMVVQAFLKARLA